jgi:hypothetical protein
MNDYYRIVPSILVLEQLRSIVDRATEAGRELEFARSLNWVMSELERTPLEFGEGQYTNMEKGLKVRLAFVGPITVRFGVHDSTKQVFIGWIRGKF